MPVQIFAGRDQLDRLLVVESHAREEVEELRPFIPPMAEQLGVIRRDDERRTIQNSREPPDLRHAFVEEMSGVFARSLERMVALVNLLGAAPRR